MNLVEKHDLIMISAIFCAGILVMWFFEIITSNKLVVRIGIGDYYALRMSNDTLFCFIKSGKYRVENGEYILEISKRMMDLCIEENANKYKLLMEEVIK